MSQAQQPLTDEQIKAIAAITGGWLSKTLYDYDLPHTNGDIAWRTRKINGELQHLFAEQLAAREREWHALLDRAVSGEVVKIERDGVTLSLSSMDGHRKGMSRVVDSAMTLGREIERINAKKQQSAKGLTAPQGESNGTTTL